MAAKTVKILFIADIVGDPGIKIALNKIPGLKQKYDINMCIANGENACNGKSLTPRIVRCLVDAGVNVITSGNHIWSKDAFRPHLDKFDMVLRPANYPSENQGKGICYFTTKENLEIAVLNVQGRTYMQPIDCPFKKTSEELIKISKKTNLIIVDLHAEATAEKVAFGHHFDGQVSAVIGTHTHIQTADEKILDKGTGYITDAGMTGPADSVLGMDKNTAIKRFTHQVPSRHKIADGVSQLNGVVLELDSKSGSTISIKRINIKENGNI